MTPVTASDIRGHLRILHGIVVDDEPDLRALRECHQSDHDTPWSHARITHDHRPVRAGNTNNNEGTATS